MTAGAAAGVAGLALNWNSGLAAAGAAGAEGVAAGVVAGAVLLAGAALVPNEMAGLAAVDTAPASAAEPLPGFAALVQPRRTGGQDGLGSRMLQAFDRRGPHGR